MRRENSVKANVFFKDLDYEIIDTQPSYTVRFCVGTAYWYAIAFPWIQNTVDA